MARDASGALKDREEHEAHGRSPVYTTALASRHRLVTSPRRQAWLPTRQARVPRLSRHHHAPAGLASDPPSQSPASFLSNPRAGRLGSRPGKRELRVSLVKSTRRQASLATRQARAPRLSCQVHAPAGFASDPASESLASLLLSTRAGGLRFRPGKRYSRVSLVM